MSGRKAATYWKGSLDQIYWPKPWCQGSQSCRWDGLWYPNPNSSRCDCARAWRPRCFGYRPDRNWQNCCIYTANDHTFGPRSCAGAHAAQPYSCTNPWIGRSGCWKLWHLCKVYQAIKGAADWRHQLSRSGQADWQRCGCFDRNTRSFAWSFRARQTDSNWC